MGNAGGASSAADYFTPSPGSPANLQRIFNWNETVIQYDSGAQQADSPYYKPFYNWQVNIGNMNELKQAPLATFINSLKGMTRPFLLAVTR